MNPVFMCLVFGSWLYSLIRNAKQITNVIFSWTFCRHILRLKNKEQRSAIRAIKIPLKNRMWIYKNSHNFKNIFVKSFGQKALSLRNHLNVDRIPSDFLEGKPFSGFFILGASSLHNIFNSFRLVLVLWRLLNQRFLFLSYVVFIRNSILLLT